MAVLLIDASINKRVATELRKRGREAVSVHQLGLGGHLDPQLLRAAHERYLSAEWVLVTSDDSMPATHADVVAELGATIATLDGRWRRYSDDQEAYKREVVHRWVHTMAEQEQGTVRRYTPNAHRLWTPRKG